MGVSYVVVVVFGLRTGGDVLNDAISIAQELLTLIPLNFHRPWVPLAYYPPDPQGGGLWKPKVSCEGGSGGVSSDRVAPLGAQWQRSSEALASGTPRNTPSRSRPINASDIVQGSGESGYNGTRRR